MTKKLHLIVLLWIAAVLSLSAAESSQSKKTEAPIYLTPETAGPDFLIQGEYEGPMGKGKLGAQIIATDPGEFHAVFLRGGLTGAGWDTMSRVDVDGKAENGKATFMGVWQATIENGVLTGKTKSGESFELKRIVRHSPTEGAKAPAGAVVLFDGTNADTWNNGKMDERKLLACGTTGKQIFNDFTLHIEFIVPFQPGASYGVRGNSGVYLQDRYEIQILDSFGRPLNPHECGVIYCLNLPRYNMAYPPLQWQTYDIDFQAARFDEVGKKIRNAIVTVKLNGVMIHESQDILRLTGGHGIKTESVEGGPFKLQAHGSPVFFRNIWVVEKK